MDCVTGSPMADTCVRQVVPGRWGGEAAATESAQAGFSSPGGVVGRLKRAGGMFWWVSPLSRGRLILSLRYPQGSQSVVVSGRVSGMGPARAQVVTSSL